MPYGITNTQPSITMFVFLWQTSDHYFSFMEVKIHTSHIPKCVLSFCTKKLLAPNAALTGD